MLPRTHGHEHRPPVTLPNARDGARIARLVVGAAIYTAAALMLLR